MLEGKRQKQVAGLLNKELSDIFQRLGLNMIDGGMVSIAGVKITPDLFDARIYLSFFKVKDNDAALKKIEEHSARDKKRIDGKSKAPAKKHAQTYFLYRRYTGICRKDRKSYLKRSMKHPQLKPIKC